MNLLVEELKWRGLVHNIIPGTEEQLSKEMTTGYIGFDPTADSLHIGSLVPIILLMHLQRYGHKPVALVGGATGMIGDPTGKSNERNLIDDETLAIFVKGIRSQLERFLDFDESKPNAAVMVNNYDWMKEFSFLSFIRDIGKHLTVNYMMAKDSVKKRINGEAVEGMSFTEFSYQLIQGYDYFHLSNTMDMKLQMGGSDQWGNITTGVELIRRKKGAEAFAFTCPLITKADGNKFGKSEAGENIWLDTNRTSPYNFYQFWLKVADEDAKRYIKIYTFLSKEEINQMITSHDENPEKRELQKKLAYEVTSLVHGIEETNKAIQASEILFGNSSKEVLESLDENTFLSVFSGVPQREVSLSEIEKGVNAIDLLSDFSGFLPSKSEARRALVENSVSVNQEKIEESFVLNTDKLLQGKYLLLQRGKKNKYILKAIK